MRSDDEREARLARHESDFMALVETHERQWGTKSYRGRPSLNDILQAHIVAVWHTDQHPYLIFTLHSQFRELEIYFYKSLFRPPVEIKKTGQRRLMRIYQDKERMVAKNLSIQFIPVQK